MVARYNCRLARLALLALVVCVFAVLLSACATNTQNGATNSTAAESSASTASQSSASASTESSTSSGSTAIENASSIDYSKGIHHAVIEVQDMGTIEVELNATIAPLSVSNFARLAEAHFYDGLTFHRIITGFMVQGGAPNENSDLSQLEFVKGEFSANGVLNTIKHERGTISMARASDYDSGNSQFFIMHVDNSSLDGQYAAFGHVTSGMDVVDKLAETPVEDSNGTVAEQNQSIITSIRMVD
ncbi:MAG: peptidylprolyl isomerase [Atopobiaceae bacterium]|nr:peptidylprolyl isomerase [Atopobiaceae bacterium]